MFQSGLIVLVVVVPSAICAVVGMTLAAARRSPSLAAWGVCAGCLLLGRFFDDALQAGLVLSVVGLALRGWEVTRD